MANKSVDLILSAVKSAGEAALRLHEESESLRSRLAEYEKLLAQAGEAFTEGSAAIASLQTRLADAELDLRSAVGERDRVWLARLADVESRLNLADAEVTMLRHFNAEADALLLEARMGVENSAVQFGYPYTEYVARINAHLSRKEGA